MSSTRSRLIELLQTHNHEYISGQILAEKLNISRNAIWKHMQELADDGYNIDARPRLGYRIIDVPDKVSENTIQWGLQTNWLGQRIVHKTSLPSTQTLAHQLAQKNAKHGTVIIADEQTTGKGRMGRSWDSNNTDGIWLSMIVRPQIPPYLAPQLTLLTATVLADLIKEETNLQPQIKWPNDLLIDQKKISGILTEMHAEQDQILYVIIGIGLNVNQSRTDFDDIVQKRATSLYEETNKQWDRHRLIQQLLNLFEKSYESYIGEGFTKVKQKWESYGFRIGEQINIKTMKHEWTSQFLGIAEDGALLITNPEGKQDKLYSGEIQWFARGYDHENT
ncbi:MAG TPA: biotin--[acetyl-CoA-carboxylase] ligase [Bacillota bacterium]|nr:biotin--[acetyl-CoA-carboxylase] ligase [Bacillota bacterium]